MPATTEAPSTILDQLKALIRLQYIDSRIDQIEKLRGDLPEEIRDLEDERAGLATRIDKAKREIMEGEARQKKLALDVVESEAMIKKYEEQQLQVRNNREYDALTKEIEAQRQKITAAHLETEELTVTIERDKEAIVGAEERLSELESILKEKQADLEQVVEDTKKEQQGFQAKRDEAAQAIEGRYFQAYERLRGRLRDGRAVVPLERGAAGGFQVPPQRQVEIRQRNRIIPCEHTGRIIVDDALFQETVAELDF
ncbi:MAG: hypothetical protein AAGF99_07485 [Bacteroidota bacterium]